MIAGRAGAGAPLPLRRLRVWLGGPARVRRGCSADREMTSALRIRWLARIFYLVTLHFAFETQRHLVRLAGSDRQIDPLWPVAWIDQASFSLAAHAVGLAFLAGALAAVIAPDSRPLRCLVALLFLQALAIENSFGSINHYGHVGLWLAVVFAAMPGFSEARLRRSRADRRSYLTLFFLAQALVGLFYTSSGARKAYYGLFVPDGSISSFAPDALPLLVVQKWLQTGDQPLLAELFMQHSWLAWPTHLLVIYVELFALVAVFRPELHVLWGTMLIVFHLLVWLLLGISFAYQPVLIALIFVCSPFAPERRFEIRAIVRQLPLFGDLAVLWPAAAHPARPRRWSS